MRSISILWGRRSCLPLFFALIAIVASTTAAGASDWWSDTVFYEVFVRSFYDSNGDGIGDLQGLIQKLDYLNDGDPATTDDLGITGIWLMPICESPSYHGYDVTDYYAIERDYGTMEDFQQLLDAAHARGIRVIVDLVLNHTSSNHPWFKASRGPESETRDWYIWSDGFPGYTGPWGQRVWHFGGAGFYYGLFWNGMPDLNYRNPAVSIQMFDVVRYWLDEVGVDGFRLDAIRHLIEDGEQQENTAATHFWLKGLNAVAKGWNPSGLLLGEVWDSSEAILPYLDGELDLCFEFSLADAILSGVRSSRKSGIEDTLRSIQSLYPAGRYATFLSNHDQERLMTTLRGNELKARLASSILLTLPGTPFIYYGEEIGMTGTKPDERIRTPMQWNEQEAAGFTTATPWEALANDRLGRSVLLQTDDPGSLLSRYRDVIAIRNAHAALRTGELVLVDAGHPALLSYLRRSEDEILWVIHNLSAFKARPSRLVPEQMLGGLDAFVATDLLDEAHTMSVSVSLEGDLRDALPSVDPYQTRILKLE